MERDNTMTNGISTRYTIFHSDQFGNLTDTGRKCHARQCEATKELNRLTEHMPFALRINYAVLPVFFDEQYHCRINVAH
jgi:hypothetical protein